MIQVDSAQFPDFANSLADNARTIALKYFRSPLDVENKIDNTPVSIADKEIEQVIRGTIFRNYSDHGFFGEEHGIRESNSQFVWVVDPIDGTKSFITGQPGFGTLISLLKNGKPVLGIIEMPALNERWVGVSNFPTVFNGQAVTTRNTKLISEAIICTTSIDFFNDPELIIFNSLSKRGYFRLFGGDCYNYGLLASGYVDVVVESNLKPYDYMALIPVIEGAGGIVSDWQGNCLTLQSKGQVLACANRQLHNQCLDEINKNAAA